MGSLSGCAYLGPLSPLAPLERSVLFQPAPFPNGNWDPAGLGQEDAWFESDDGVRLHGWFVARGRPRAVALFLHGNAGNITSRESVLRVLRDRHNLAVMTFDYRGYGRSEGQPNETGLLKDARAARAWLAKRTGVRESDIIVFGRSLGGGVAVDLAAKDGARGLVLSSTFTSLPDVGAHHFRLIPTHLLMTNRFDSLNKIKRYQGPLLQSHGSEDQVVPYSLGQQLFDAAPGPKLFVTVVGGGHNDPWNAEFHAELEQLLGAIAAPRSAVGAR